MTTTHDDPDVDDMTATELAILAELEDDTPSEEQINYVKNHGAVVVKPSDRSKYGGTPLGETPEDTADQITFQMVTDNGIQNLMTLPFGGKNDPYLRAALAKYANAMRDATPGEARDKATLKAFAEAAEARKAASEVENEEFESSAVQLPNSSAAEDILTRSSPRRQRGDQATAEHQSAAPQRPSVTVGISLGSIGRLDMVFRDAIIEGQALVLVADPPAPGRPSWVPPPPEDPPVPLTLYLDGVPPVKAFPMDLSYPYDGAVHYVLMIDRPTE